MVNGVGDVLGADDFFHGIFGELIGAPVSLAALNATAGQHDALAGGPVVPAGTGLAAGTGIADLWFAPHLAGEHDERGIEQPAVGEILNQRRITAVEPWQEIFFEAVEIISVRIPATSTAAFLGEGAVDAVHFPEHGDKRHTGFHQPPGHQQAHAVEMFAVTLADFLRFTGDIKRAGGGGAVEQVEGLLLLACVIRDCWVSLGTAPGIVDGLEEHFALGEALAVQSLGQGEGGRGEFQRRLVPAVDVKGIMLQSEASGKLAWARVGRAAGLGGQGDDLRQLGMFLPSLANHAAHVRGIGGVRAAVVALRAEGEIRHIAGEIVIIAGMMIAGGAAEIGHRPHDGQVFALLGG